jgi:competence protein ComK
MKKYEINRDTLAVVGVNDTSSKVIESNKNYIIEDSSYQVMEDSCNYFGSNIKGRIEGTRKMLGINYKVPIIVEESNDLIFFPLSEIENDKCIWISLNWYDRVVSDNKKTYIYFKNGRKIEINISKYIVENQASRATRLNYVLNDRKKVQKY